MKQYEYNDYCKTIGLDPHLSSYPKTHDQANYLLALMKRLKKNLWWTDAAREYTKVRPEIYKFEKDIQEDLDELAKHIHIEEVILDAPVPPRETLREFDRRKRQDLWDELKDQGFTNIEKLLAAINTVLNPTR